ncbi:hypothetical protein ACFWWM_37860 [Streptomyces sp. NPDC058682]|uniref:hypothetical protein n=1 Tax=Streptomyces sp. NPDC058682 TaxID=3346596 RepID=UPI00365DE675
MRSRIVRGAGIAAAVVLGAAGCSSGPGDTGSDRSAGSSAAGQGFWGAHGADGTSEANPPASIEALAQRADIVVLGTVTGVGEGKDYSDAGKAPNRTSNLVLRVDRSSGATLTSALVEVTRAPVTTLKDIAGDMPKGQYVFYLKRWYEGPDGPVYRCASPAKCVVGVNEGALETPRDPEAANELQSSSKGLPQSSGSSRSLNVEDLFTASTNAK